ncbi:MAG: efflux RND transporter permease subunit, partial [bacterium]|nr:efflux RND transporter permease subunit [bacterium]
GKLPKDAVIQYNVPYFGATGGDTDHIDLGISFYSDNPEISAEELNLKAEAAKTWLEQKQIYNVKAIKIKNPFNQVTNPSTGEQIKLRQNYDRYAEKNNGNVAFSNSIFLAVAAEKESDVIKLDHDVREALTALEADSNFSEFNARVSASFAPDIDESLTELQKVLLEGLLAVLIVGSLVIAIRASLITVISMVTVILITLGLMYAIGYTLNVITLFALILGLALIVDDTIIMVEAIDAARKRSQDRRKIIRDATRKISRAMVAATLTAALSFAPLLFIGGVLGSFIRAIPITLISSLLISLVVALVFIPWLSRYILLSEKQLGKKAAKEFSAGFEAKLAHFVTAPMRAARHSNKRLAATTGIAIGIGLGFVMLGVVISRNVVFNIFPASKDSNGLIFSINMPPGTSLEQSEGIASEAENLIVRELGDNFERASYYNSGSSSSANLAVDLKPYDKRQETSQEMLTRLQSLFDGGAVPAQVIVGQMDVGPPASAFIVEIAADNREGAFRLAGDIANYMESSELKRIDNSSAKFQNITVSSPDSFLRNNGKPIVRVSSSFDGDDTSTLVSLAQNAVNQNFSEEKVASYAIESDALTFDLGQESENQDSFKSLAFAFPILLVVIYILLLIEFRSFLQPLLIFMAIPFSIFGVMTGLDLTNNAISFFSMLGFFALIGLSIKNTILLTDYANQARRSGMSPIDSTVAALEERFRPLFATSATAVVSLTPLALSSPFWQGLAVVLIFGLVSSTFLVITVFPYYYLAGEYARLAFSRKFGRARKSD